MHKACADSVEVSCPAQLEKEMRQLIVDGNKINQIRAVRVLTGCGLAEAKKVVEAFHAWADR